MESEEAFETSAIFGWITAVTYIRAGATLADLVKLLPADPADYAPEAYADLVRKIRGLLGTEGPKPCVRNCPFLKNFGGHLQ